MVVPRSSIQVAQDDEFILFAVTTFKKHSAEFQQKCREQKWTPRQYKYVEGGKEEEQKELDRVAREEKKVWGEALRLTRTGWSESVMVWAHIMALRVFVESVLRYGLPLEFVSALVLVGALLNFPCAGVFYANSVPTDKPEASEKGKDGTRLILLIPGRKCVRKGQERKDYERRRRAHVRDGGSWARARWGRQRVHGIRILRVRTIDSSIQAAAANSVGWRFRGRDNCHGLASPGKKKGASNCHIISYRTHNMGFFCVHSSKAPSLLQVYLSPVPPLFYSDIVFNKASRA